MSRLRSRRFEGWHGAFVRVAESSATEEAYWITNQKDVREGQYGVLLPRKSVVALHKYLGDLLAGKPWTYKPKKGDLLSITPHGFGFAVRLYDVRKGKYLAWGIDHPRHKGMTSCEAVGGLTVYELLAAGLVLVKTTEETKKDFGLT